MNYSVFEVFRIGIGPSSSHTVGPMSAVNRFLNELDSLHLIEKIVKVKVHLYGSLALTGIGHGTDTAVILGMLGEVPQTVDPAKTAPLIADIKDAQLLSLMGKHEIAFEYAKDIVFHHAKSLPEHPNGMLLEAFGADQVLLYANTYFSIGGGAVLDLAEIVANKTQSKAAEKSQKNQHPYAFSSAAELLGLGQKYDLSIAEMVWQNELQYQDAAPTRKHLLDIWTVMNSSIERGLHSEGILPGGLKVKRRAASLYRQSSVFGGKLTADFQAMDMVSAFAIAVNEENACGGRVVTAPTNGSAGVIPAVLAYYTRFGRQSAAVQDDDIVKFLLTAAGIGMLYKKKCVNFCSRNGLPRRNWRIVFYGRSGFGCSAGGD